MSPSTAAFFFNSTFAAPTTLPVTLPPMVTALAIRSATTVAPSPIVRLWSPSSMVPSTLPSMIRSADDTTLPFTVTCSLIQDAFRRSSAIGLSAVASRGVDSFRKYRTLPCPLQGPPPYPENDIPPEIPHSRAGTALARSTSTGVAPMFLRMMSVLAIGLTLAACAPAYAQWGNRSRYGSNGYRVERQVYDQGYQDGYRQGREDARTGDRYDPRGQREYRSA